MRILFPFLLLLSAAFPLRSQAQQNALLVTHGDRFDAAVADPVVAYLRETLQRVGISIRLASTPAESANAYTALQCPEPDCFSEATFAGDINSVLGLGLWRADGGTLEMRLSYRATSTCAGFEQRCRPLNVVRTIRQEDTAALESAITSSVATLFRWINEGAPVLLINATPAYSRIVVDSEPCVENVVEGCLVRHLTPGPHLVEVAAEGYGPESRSVTLSEHEDTEIAVALTSTGQGSAEPSEQSALRFVPPAALMAAGAATVTLAGVAAAQAGCDARYLTPDMPCRSGRTRSRAAIGTMAGLGIGALAGGLIWALTLREPTPSSRAQVTITPGGVGIRGTF